MNAPLASSTFAICPCCGQSVAAIDRPIVDADNCMISWLGHTVVVPRGNRTKILKAMADRYPAGLTVDELAFALWQGSNREPELADKSLHVYLHSLRKLLSYAPFTISRGGGGVLGCFALIRRDFPTGVRGELKGEPRVGRPPGPTRAYALKLFQAGGVFGRRDIRRKLAQHGVVVSSQTISNALESLVRGSYVERVSHGLYQLRRGS
jgi:hypothetical protein